MTKNGCHDSYIEDYGTRNVSFRFRGRAYTFTLSHGLFSAADIDSGSRFLLAVFSRILDEDIEKQRPLPGRILDAGCGAGVLGICAAGAIIAPETPAAPALGGKPCLHVRSQDRDELARIFTEHNARQNDLGPETLNAWTEPLLAGAGNWDLILSNIPAKAGLPVLEDFIDRSAALLNPGGRVLLVAVHTLSDFFFHRIQAAASLLCREDGPGHTVFLYTRKEEKSESSVFCPDGDDFFIQCPGYIRNRNDYEMKKTPYHLDTVHGAPGFDSPGGAVLAAAKLTSRLREAVVSCSNVPAMIWEDNQGHFSTWLAAYVRRSLNFVLAGRNILSLGIARRNIAGAQSSAAIVSAVDLYIDRERILAGTETQGFSFIAAFPEIIPRTNVLESLWKGLTALALPSGLLIVGLPSAEAERFDRIKPKDFSRLGDLRRKGFRALAYRKCTPIEKNAKI